MTEALTLDQILTNLISGDEGLKLYVYDDKNDQPIVPGYTVVGNPTIGYGTLLSLPGGITKEEAAFLMQGRILRAKNQAQTLTWFGALDPVRQAVIVSMVYQMGLGGLSEFKQMIGAICAQDWAAASAQMLLSRWAKTQTPSRAHQLSQAMLSGTL